MDEQFMERAQALEQAERDLARDQITQTLSRPGQPYCDDCGEAIPVARRVAHPAAHRCISCQTTFEYLKKGMHDERNT